MSWYYVANGERKGPIEQAEFDRLVQSGFIVATTLVWREGMTDWRPQGEFATQVAPPSVNDPSRPTVVCSECGRAFGLDQTIRLGNGHVCGDCKAVALQKLREGVVENDDEKIRRDHIKHEASVKSIGSLYFLAALFLILAGVAALFVPRGSGPIAGFFFLFIAGLLITAGIGLQRLKTWSRIVTATLAVLGLLAFPFGTIINAYILYLVFCKKGSTVFSDDYKRVIEATPHIKYKTSIVLWIALIVVLLLLGLGFFAVLWGGRR